MKSMNIISTAQICIFACDITSDFEVSEEHVDLHSMQEQTKTSDFIQELLCDSQKQNSELCKLMGVVTVGMPSMKMVWCLLFTSKCTS